MRFIARVFSANRLLLLLHRRRLWYSLLSLSYSFLLGIKHIHASWIWYTVMCRFEYGFSIFQRSACAWSHTQSPIYRICLLCRSPFSQCEKANEFRAKEIEMKRNEKENRTHRIGIVNKMFLPVTKINSNCCHCQRRRRRRKRCQHIIWFEPIHKYILCVMDNNSIYVDRQIERKREGADASYMCYGHNNSFDCASTVPFQRKKLIKWSYCRFSFLVYVRCDRHFSLIHSFIHTHALILIRLVPIRMILLAADLLKVLLIKIEFLCISFNESNANECLMWLSSESMIFETCLKIRLQCCGDLFHWPSARGWFSLSKLPE